MKVITKKDIVTQVLESKDIASKAAAKRVVNNILSIINDNLQQGNVVRLSGIGTLKPAIANEKRVLAFGKQITIPKRNVVKFKIAKQLKTKIN